MPLSDGHVGPLKPIVAIAGQPAISTITQHRKAKHFRWCTLEEAYIRYMEPNIKIIDKFCDW